MTSTAGRTGSDGLATPAAEGSVPAQRRRRGQARPTPVLDDTYAHLSIDALRDHRRALADEEDKVSYWRRILQARLDLVVAGCTDHQGEHARLTALLASERVGLSRRALVSVVPLDEIPPLPRLEQLWERRPEPGDEAGRASLEADLRTAELQLSTYRTALHAKITEATGELIARYREHPELCLRALPVPPQRRGA